MPVPTHFRFTFRGIFSNSPEAWSFGCHFQRDAAGSPDAELSDINEGGITDALTTFMGSGVMDAGCEAVDWRAYVIGTNGRMQGNGPLLHEFDSGDLHGTGAVTYPPQVALCATLVAENRGPGKLGRFYIPGPPFGLDAGRRLSLTNATIAAQAVSAFLKDISDAIDMPGALDSSSALNISSRGGGAGTQQTVQHVEVGRVLDTMRSRRSQLLEERVVDTNIDW